MRRARRLLPTGLRARLVLAMTAIGLATLAVGAGGVLGPLTATLRNEEVSRLRDATLAGRAWLRGIDPRDLHAGDPQLGFALDQIRRRTRSRVLLVGAGGTVLSAHGPGGADAPPAPGPLPHDVLRALTTGHVQASGSGSGESAEARVAVPVRIDRERVVLATRRPLDDASAAARVVRRAFLPAAAAALALALALSLLVSFRLVRRLRRLRDTALDVAAAGVPAPVAPDPARDEVGDLGRAFARMQERLDEQERARRTFVATASHELRTPLSSLRLMLDLLREGLDDDAPDLDRARDQASRAGTQAERLAVLAGQLLDLSRIDAGVPVRVEPVDVGAVAEEAAAEIAERAAAAGVEVTVHAAHDGAGAWALADPGATTQIVRVLLDNALRHAPPGSEVDVEVDTGAGEAVEVVVRDDGPGVPAEDRERIFERFERGGATVAAEAPGFGLGLAIARELARRMGGELTLDASGGPGASFRLALTAQRWLRMPKSVV